MPLIQIWGRAEATNKKEWTSDMQPYLPFIVFEKDNSDLVSIYYDNRGVEWLKKTTVSLARNDKDFLKNLDEKSIVGTEKLSKFYDKSKRFSREELIEFMDNLVIWWSFFEAFWWLLESNPEIRKDIIIPDTLITIREKTENWGDLANEIFINSLKEIYPSYSDLVHLLTIEEIRSDQLPEKEELEERGKGYRYVNDILFVGKPRKYIEDTFNIEIEKLEFDESITEIKGQKAYGGNVKGVVKKIFSKDEIEKVTDGDILVTFMTVPEFIPAMKRAGAFITDEGGVLCHAAIVAREFKKPCIIGTKIATQILKDGDMVEVDADNGIIKIIK